MSVAFLGLAGVAAAANSISAASNSTSAAASSTSAAAKNIVFIVADDLGFNDVSFHGSTQIPTPAIDELAATGLTLDNYHAQPVCSPTRASILSGRHAIHHGIYMPFGSAELRLNLTYTLLPGYLKRLGYETHAVGKWHIGENELAALPTGRGFDSYYGYWGGAEDYYTHSTGYHANGEPVYDFADGTRTCFEANGTYSTYLLAARAVEIIETAGAAPFFMYLAFQNVHWPLQAPQQYLDRFANATGGDAARQAVAAMASILDDGVRNVTDALKARGIWESTLLVFVADNGGPTNGDEGTASNNFPMRGGKNTLWEGGTRVVGVVRGAGVGPSLRGTTSRAPIHAVDWLRTVLHFASDGAPLAPPAAEPPYLDGDGVNVWETLATGKAVRTELLLECHPPDGGAARGGAALRRWGYRYDGADLAAADGLSVHGNAIIVGDWKYVQLGPTRRDEEAGWHPPPGQDAATTKYTLGCDLAQQPTTINVTAQCIDAPCLFHVADDPCEYHDRAKAHPQIVARLEARLAELQATAVPPVKPDGCDALTVDGALRPCDAPDPGE